MVKTALVKELKKPLKEIEKEKGKFTFGPPCSNKRPMAKTVAICGGCTLD